MKKILFIITMIFILCDFVYAENKMKYVDKENKYYVVIDKDQFVLNQYNKELVSMYSTDFKLPEVINSKTYENVGVYTYALDEVYNTEEKWWGQITVCVIGTDYGLPNKILSLGDVTASVGAYAFTDVANSSLATNVMENNPTFGWADDDDDYIDWYEGIFGESVTNCFLMEPSEDIPFENLTNPCDPYDVAKLKLDTMFLNYDKKTASEKIQIKEEYNNQKLRLKSLCESMLENLDADQTCVKRCLTFQNDIDKYDKIMKNTSNKKICGFSERLLVWVSNILRWIKYILPVFVIILAILDFVKAIGADKDDEMKKAQKRFITRLIAATLVFIIPLILEFVLTKMGFGYDSCGLF